jgi:SH3-like domain-containing protein
MRIKTWATACMAVAGAAALAVGDAQAEKKQTPYYASISASRARMRTGPGRNYPASWLYQRSDLPVKVVEIYKEWRKVEDPAGTQGWMLANLLSSTRTAVVAGAPVELRDGPRPGGRILWRAAPGVIGRLSKCSGGWCWFDVHGRGGFVEPTRLWGVEGNETLP